MTPDTLEGLRKGTSRPQIVYYAAASLDGYIATPEGGVDWLAPFEGTGEDYGYAKFFNSVDAILLGRRTYDKSLEFGQWPYANKPCWVFSRDEALRPARAAVEVTAQAPAQVASELVRRGLRRAWLVGGGNLAAAFRSEGLITEYVVSVVPLLLGAGVPLFGPGGAREKLKLVGSKSYPNGLVQLRYVRDTPRHG
jgi:dihydrofolate reductase